MDNGRNFILSKQLDSQDSGDEDYSVDYCITTDIERDRYKRSKYEYKKMHTKQLYSTFDRYYMDNGCNFNLSKQLDSRDSTDEDGY